LKGVIARKKLFAPIDGRILKIQPQKGSVLSPGSLVLSMVPDGVNLIAEVKISNHDIGHINVGDPVKLKFNTYDYARYGALEGSLKEISPFTLKKDNEISDEEGYYRGIIELTQNYLGKEKGIHTIFPGMTLQAEIVTGEKTVMEYILKPIYTSAENALHER
jgi:HlyD family secretion protein/adhesin transport system membrane fusion protein